MCRKLVVINKLSLEAKNIHQHAQDINCYKFR